MHTWMPHGPLLLGNKWLSSQPADLIPFFDCGDISDKCMASGIRVSCDTASEKYIKAEFTGQIPCRVCVSLGSQAGSLEVLLVGNADVHVGREQLCLLVGPLCGHWKWSRQMTKTAFQEKMAFGTAILKQFHMQVHSVAFHHF